MTRLPLRRVYRVQLEFSEAQEFLDDSGLLADVVRDFGSADAYVEAVFDLAAALNALPNS